MEYTQWGTVGYYKVIATGLNPCCNGIYSMREDWLAANPAVTKS